MIDDTPNIPNLESETSDGSQVSNQNDSSHFADNQQNETFLRSLQRVSSNAGSSLLERLRALRAMIFNKSIEEGKEIDEIKNSGNLLTLFIDRYIRKRHCPYCFGYVTKRIYRERTRKGHKNTQVSGITMTLPTIKTYECLHCKSALPSDFFYNKSTSIAVVGGRDSGKSSFITVFCELLLHQKTILNELGLFGSIINSEGIELFEENRQRLIKQDIALSATANVQSPIVVRLQSEHHSEVIYITFLDSPGEDFENVDTLIEHYPNLQLAGGIIFLMNPLDVTGISELIEEENPGTTPSAYGRKRIENFNIIQNLYELYTTMDRIKPNQSIKIPTVFCLSRADILEDVSNVYLPNDLDPNLITKDDLIDEMELVSQDLRAFITDVDKRLLSIINKYFKKHQLFPVSPLGKTPTPQGSRYKIEGGIEPKGVLQPFLWILIKAKFI